MKRISFFLIVSIILASCHETKIGSIDLDFNSKIVSPDGAKTYVSKPIRIGLEVSDLDPNNNYPMQTTFSFPEEAGIIKIDDVEIDKGEKRTHDFQKKPVLWFEVIPSKKGNFKLGIDVVNAKVQKHNDVDISCSDVFYIAETRGIPEKPLIDKKITFDLIISEREDTDVDKVTTRALVLKGAGDIYVFDELVNAPSEEGEEPQTRSAEIAIGKTNTVSYVAKEAGENVIQFELSNPWGYSSIVNVPINVQTPDWDMSSEQGENITIYLGKENSFILNLTENDEFGINEFTGAFRFLENNIPVVSINSKEHKQGEEYSLKVGTNVFVVTPKEEGVCNMELIANDKYGSERKDTITFIIDKGIRELVSSVDNTSQTVKVNQSAPVKLSINEENYQGTFNVKYELLTGSGSFSGGAEQTLAAGIHSMSFTPNKPGTHTYKLIVTDTNKQTKEINISVIANASPLSASINETDKEITAGEKAEVELMVSEPDYSGKFYVRHGIAGLGGKLSVNGTTISSGVTVPLNNQKNTISFAPDGIGSSTVALIVSDEYKQEHNLILRVITKANILAKAQIGGFVSGGGKYGKGESCTLKANTITGYGFSGWYEGEIKVSSDLNYTFAVTGNRSLEARFTKNSYTVSTSAQTGGTITGAGSYKYNENCTLSATPQTGYTFSGWYEGSTKVSANASYTFAVTDNRSLEARFTINTFTISATASIGGTVKGGDVYNYGASCSLVATPANGYSFEGWYENDKQVSTNLNYVFQVTSARTLLAKFVLNSIDASVDNSSQTVKVNQVAPIKLSINESNYQGTFNVKYELLTGSGSFSGGASQTLAAGTHSMSYTPDQPGTHTYKLTVTDANKQNHDVNVTVIANASPLSASINETDKEITAGEKAEVELMVSEPDYSGKFYVKHGVSGINGKLSINGTIISSGVVAVLSGSKSLVSFIPDGIGSTTLALNVSDEYKQEHNLILRVTTKANILAKAQIGGFVSGGGKYGKGESCTLKANTITGYGFSGWYEGEIKVSPDLNYTFAVTGNRSLEARFTKNSYTVSASAQTGGTITGAGSYKYNENCTLSATPQTGYTFTGWYEGSTKVSANASYTFAVTDNRSLEARFTINSHIISATAQTGGTVSGGKSYDYGASCTLVASPKNGFSFDGWYENDKQVSTSISYTFTVTGNRSLEARFKLNELSASVDNSSQTVKVNQAAPVKLNISESNYQGTFNVKYELLTGSGSFSGGASQTLAAGTHSMSFTPNKPGTHTYKLTVTDVNNQAKVVNVTVIANASPLSVSVNKNNITCFTGETSEIVLAISEDSYSGGFKIKQQQTGASGVVSVNGTELGNGLSLNGKNGNNSIKFRSTAAGTANITLSITDDFNQDKSVTITVVSSKITISASAQTGGTVTGAGSYNSGASCTLVATTSAGYTFAGWYEANAKVSANTSYTFTVTGNRSLEARFTINSYTISTSAQTGGSASGGGSFNYGTSRTVTASTNTGYTFAGWYEGSTKVSTSASYTFTVTGNRSLEARFTINSYTISTSAQTGGSASGGGSFNYGTSRTVTASTNTGYTFAGWYEGSTKVSASTSYTFTVTGNRSLEARFTINSYTISTSAQTGGSASGGGSFNYGTSRTVIASANTEYTFAGWYEGSTKVSSSTSYTFTVTGNRSLEARFTINSYTISTSAQTGGSVSGGGSFNYGTSRTITASASIGYTFAGWYEGNTKVSDNESYTFTLTGNRTFQARFTFINSTKTEVFGTYCHGDEYDVTVTYPIYVKKGSTYSNFWTNKRTKRTSCDGDRYPLYGLGIISGNAILVNMKTDHGLTFYEGFTPQSTGKLTLRLRAGHVDTSSKYGAIPSYEAPNDSDGYLEFTVIVVD